MSTPGLAILQQVDLRNPYAAWLSSLYGVKLGAFYQLIDDTLVGVNMNQVNVRPYTAEDGKTRAVGFADEEIAAQTVVGSALYNMTMGDDYMREVTLGLKARLWLKNAHASTAILMMDDIAAHPSGIQKADTQDQFVIGSSLMPIPVGYRGQCYVDLINQRLVP